MNILLDGTNFDEDWAYESLCRFINAETRILIVPFAIKDKLVSSEEQWHDCFNMKDGKIVKRFVKPFLRYGVVEKNVTFLNYYVHTSYDLKVILKNKDVVYFSGGLPDRATCRLKKSNMMDVINSYKGIIVDSSNIELIGNAKKHSEL